MAVSLRGVVVTVVCVLVLVLQVGFLLSTAGHVRMLPARQGYVHRTTPASAPCQPEQAVQAGHDPSPFAVRLLRVFGLADPYVVPAALDDSHDVDAPRTAEQIAQERERWSVAVRTTERKVVQLQQQERMADRAVFFAQDGLRHVRETIAMTGRGSGSGRDELRALQRLRVARERHREARMSRLNAELERFDARQRLKELGPAPKPFVPTPVKEEVVKPPSLRSRADQLQQELAYVLATLRRHTQGTTTTTTGSLSGIHGDDKGNGTAPEATDLSTRETQLRQELSFVQAALRLQQQQQQQQPSDAPPPKHVPQRDPDDAGKSTRVDELQRELDNMVEAEESVRNRTDAKQSTRLQELQRELDDMVAAEQGNSPADASNDTASITDEATLSARETQLLQELAYTEATLKRRQTDTTSMTEEVEASMEARLNDLRKELSLVQQLLQRQRDNASPPSRVSEDLPVADKATDEATTLERELDEIKAHQAKNETTTVHGPFTDHEESIVAREAELLRELALVQAARARQQGQGQGRQEDADKGVGETVGTALSARVDELQEELAFVLAALKRQEGDTPEARTGAGATEEKEEEDVPGLLNREDQLLHELSYVQSTLRRKHDIQRNSPPKPYSKLDQTAPQVGDTSEQHSTQAERNLASERDQHEATSDTGAQEPKEAAADDDVHISDAEDVQPDPEPTTTAPPTPSPTAPDSTAGTTAEEEPVFEVPADMQLRMDEIEERWRHLNRIVEQVNDYESKVGPDDVQKEKEEMEQLEDEWERLSNDVERLEREWKEELLHAKRLKQEASETRKEKQAREKERREKERKEREEKEAQEAAAEKEGEDQGVLMDDEEAAEFDRAYAEAQREAAELEAQLRALEAEQAALEAEQEALSDADNDDQQVEEEEMVEVEEQVVVEEKAEEVEEVEQQEEKGDEEEAKAIDVSHKEEETNDVREDGDSETATPSSDVDVAEADVNTKEEDDEAAVDDDGEEEAAADGGNDAADVDVDTSDDDEAVSVDDETAGVDDDMAAVDDDTAAVDDDTAAAVNDEDVAVDSDTDASFEHGAATDDDEVKTDGVTGIDDNAAVADAVASGEDVDTASAADDADSDASVDGEDDASVDGEVADDTVADDEGHHTEVDNTAAAVDNVDKVDDAAADGDPAADSAAVADDDGATATTDNVATTKDVAVDADAANDDDAAAADEAAADDSVPASEDAAVDDDTTVSDSPAHDDAAGTNGADETEAEADDVEDSAVDAAAVDDFGGDDDGATDGDSADDTADDSAAAEEKAAADDVVAADDVSAEDAANDDDITPEEAALLEKLQEMKRLEEEKRAKLAEAKRKKAEIEAKAKQAEALRAKAEAKRAEIIAKRDEARKRKQAQERSQSSDAAPQSREEEKEFMNRNTTGVSWAGRSYDEAHPSAAYVDGPGEIPVFPEEVPLHLADQGKMDAIREAFVHSWNGYKKYAWGWDELKPVSNTGHNWLGLSISVISALDTMWIMDLHDEFEEAKNWVAKVDFNVDVNVSVFETTIRMLGGLLSAHQMSGEPALLDKAVDLGDRLLRAWDGVSPFPSQAVNLKSGERIDIWGERANTLAEMGSLQFEFYMLSELSGDLKYQHVADGVVWQVRSFNAPDGLYPVLYNIENGTVTQSSGGPTVTFGGLADSFYEYLLKRWMLEEGRNMVWRYMYDASIDGLFKLMTISHPSQILYLTEFREGRRRPRMDHLSCFLPAMLAIGSYSAHRGQQHFQVGQALLDTCLNMYSSSPSGLAPDSVMFVEGLDYIVQDAKWPLRPETLESVFYYWRITGDDSYRQNAWSIFGAIQSQCRTESGYSGVSDVRRKSSPKDDVQQAYFLSETLKYLYLTFADGSLIPLNEYVFNTEAHPFKRFKQ